MRTNERYIIEMHRGKLEMLRLRLRNSIGKTNTYQTICAHIFILNSPINIYILSEFLISNQNKN